MYALPWRRRTRAAVLLGAGGAAAPNPLLTVPWVAQWKFNNDGNSAIGSFNLTNNNSATFTTGLLGGATGATQVLRASSQYWSHADDAGLSILDQEATILAWVKFATLPGSGEVYGIIGKFTASNWEYALYCFNNGGTVRFWFSTSANGTSTTSDAVANNFGAPVIDTWYLVRGYHDPTNNVIGISVNNGTANTAAFANGMPDTGSVFTIGKYDASHYFNGQIDNVAIAMSAASGGGLLTAEQLTAFYNSGAGTETLS